MMLPRVPRTFRRDPEPSKPFLYPRGTTLADVPPLARGLTEMQYLDHCIAEWKKEAMQNQQNPAPVPPPEPMPAPVFGSHGRVRR